MSVDRENGKTVRLFWVALIMGLALSMVLAFAVYSMERYSLLLPQAGGFLVAILVLGIGPDCTTLFLLTMVAINAVTYAGVIFLLLVAFRQSGGS